jgi:transcriptional regulator with XRE-family HTH domain
MQASIGLQSIMIYPVQIRAARSLLGMGQDELAALASISVITLKRLEAAGIQIRGSAQTLSRLQRALEAAGIVFIDQNGAQGPGVRLRDPLP